MIQHQGIWLPDGEQHLLGWMTNNGEMVDGKGSYQIKKIRRAVAACRRFRTAVDIGCHVGLWSMQLAKSFATVEGFEPVAAHRDCYGRNLVDAKATIHLHACALGAAPGKVRIDSTRSSSGDSRVGGDGDIPLKTLDSFGLTDVDFIKLDCEGYELLALQGGEQTIKRDMPTIIVEQKPGRAQRFGLPETGAVDYLRSFMGYRLEAEMSGDYLMVPA